MNMRRSFRFPMQGVIAVSTDNRNTEGALVNISTGGCAVQSDTLFQKGEYLGLRVQVPDLEIPLEVELAAVRWSIGREYGVEFIRIRDEMQKELRSLLQSQIKKNPQAAEIPQTTSARH